MWVYAPKKPTPPKVPEALKREVETKANALVESVLKPQHVQEPPPDPQFNYIEDLSTKWYPQLLLLLRALHVAGPYAMVPSFEAKFARLTYLGGERFSLAAMRHTESGWRSSPI